VGGSVVRQTAGGVVTSILGHVYDPGTATTTPGLTAQAASARA